MAEVTPQYLQSLGCADAEFVDVLSRKEPYIFLDDEFNVPALRQKEKGYMKIIAEKLPPSEDVVEVDRHIPARDGSSVPVRFHSPRNQPPNGSPVFVMLHSGGYCIGGLDNRTEDCRDFVQRWGFIVVNIDYRLAPEHPFPIPVNDAYDVVKWTAHNAESIGANLAAGFIVGGNSTGATLGAVLSLIARDEGLTPPLTGQLLSAPTVVDSEHIPSQFKDIFLARKQNAAAPFYINRLNAIFQAAYKPDTKSYLSSPLLHPEGHGNLPPAYIQVSGLDPARDDGFIYDKVLRAGGANTRLDVYPGLPHAFWAFLPQLSSSKKYRDDLNDGISWLLEQSSKPEKRRVDSPIGQNGQL